MLEVEDIIAGSTLFATYHDVGVCGNIDKNGLGVWYKTVGTGDFMSVSFQSEESSHQVSVFSGNSCSNLSCVVGNKGSPPSYSSGTVEWNSVQGQTYFIYLHSFSSENGDFELELHQDESTI